MDRELARATLPADTVELLELLAERLNIATGRFRLELAFKGGSFDEGWLHEHLTRSSLAGRDAARGAFE